MKKHWACAILLFCAVTAARADEPLSLDKVLLCARDQNPEILSALQAWKVRQADVRPAAVWENPTFSYINEEFPSGSDGSPTEKIQHYRIEQTIPFPGKLSGDAQMNYHEALIAEANYRTKLLEISSDVRMRYYQLYLTDQQLALANESVGILKNALSAAQSRLASSQSSAQDVFMAQTELEKAQNDQFELQQERRLIQLEFNSLLNQDLETPLGATEAPELVDVPLKLPDLQAIARREDPMYLSSLHEINHAQAMLRHNRLEFAPDFGVMYEREAAAAGPAGRQIGVSVSLPLWFWKPWGEWQSAKEHLSEAQENSQSMQTLVAKSVATEFVEVQTHGTLTRRYLSGVLPSARSSLTIAQEQYAGGQGDFMRLLEAYRTWISTNNDYQEELYHYGEHWSALEQWLGVDLSRPEASHE